MSKILRIIALAIVAPLVTLAQQDPQFSQYMMNPYFWNPSYSALNNQYVLGLHHRSQWLGYAPTNSSDNIQAPSTQVVTLSAPLRKINSGLGLSLLNDNIGPIRNFNASVSYSYGYKIGEGVVAAGLALGLQSMYINTDLWRPENADDITLQKSAGIQNRTMPNLKFGIGYSNDKLYIGISTNNTFSPTYTFSQSNISSKLERHYYLQSNYKIILSERVVLQPSLFAKTVTNQTSLELSNLVLVDHFWLGLAYRTSDAGTFLAGINILPDKSLKIGYNLDLSVINKTAKALTSHEIFLSYNLASFLDNRKPIVRTPRFRY